MCDWLLRFFRHHQTHLLIQQLGPCPPSRQTSLSALLDCGVTMALNTDGACETARVRRTAEGQRRRRSKGLRFGGDLHEGSQAYVYTYVLARQLRLGKT